MAAARKTRVGPYELGKTIGEGTFARVKLARDSRTGDVCAIKVLDRNHVLRHKMVEQIKREISTMKLIRHPNVVQLHEVMASKSKIYMVLDFVDGGELFDKIVNSGRLGDDDQGDTFSNLSMLLITAIAEACTIEI
jgi:serine/threonine protein kinase